MSEVQTRLYNYKRRKWEVVDLADLTVEKAYEYLDQNSDARDAFRRELAKAQGYVPAALGNTMLALIGVDIERMENAPLN